LLTNEYITNQHNTKVKKRHKALLGLGIIFIGLPLILWLSWLVTTPRPISIFIMDKTSYNQEKAKRRAINWVLMHYRFVKPNGRDYNAEFDYYGFFPVDSETYVIRDLSQYTSLEIQQLAIQYHAAYYADSHGVYSNMWPEPDETPTRVEKIYGGIDWQDLYFLEQMNRLNRLVIAEFVFLAPPTSQSNRKKAEELFGIEWKGWTGRHFYSLKQDHPDGVLPGWIPTLYEQQYGRPWEYSQPGVVLVHEDQTLIVLEQNEHMENALPLIRSSSEARKQYGMSNNISYPGWFDVTLPSAPSSSVVAWFELGLNDKGKDLLKSHGLPESFPAVILNGEQGRIYYFAGDFGHNPVSRRFVRLKGAKFLELFFNDLNDPTDKSGFFLAFYLPLMKSILANYQAEFIAD
jgi:hypothetical protein